MSNKENLEDEISKIKEEMNEIKELLKSKKKEQDDEVNIGGQPKFFFTHSSDPGDVDFDELGDTMDNYVQNILQGVEGNLKRSMASLSKTFGTKFKSSIAKEAMRGADRAMRNAERSMRKQERVLRKQEERMHRHARKIVFEPLSAEELESFLEIGSNLASALSDTRRLMILKELEEGPNYPSDLSEKLSFKGGTLKHHLDNLVQVNFISQEAVRGRYLITQLGMEALKMIEMLFRRHDYELKKSQVQEESAEEYEDDQDDTNEFEDEMVKEEYSDIEVNIDEDTTSDYTVVEEEE